MEDKARMDRKNFQLGIILGIIVFALIVGAYLFGKGQGEKNSEPASETSTTESEAISDKIVYIDVESECEEAYTFKTIDSEEKAKQYCVVFEEGKSTFDLMKDLAANNSNFTFEYKEYSFGAMITSINGLTPDVNTEFWAFDVNGQTSMQGVSDYIVQNGDKLVFRVDKVIM